MSYKDQYRREDWDRAWNIAKNIIGSTITLRNHHGFYVFFKKTGACLPVKSKAHAECEVQAKILYQALYHDGHLATRSNRQECLVERFKTVYMHLAQNPENMGILHNFAKKVWDTNGAILNSRRFASTGAT